MKETQRPPTEDTYTRLLDLIRVYSKVTDKLPPEEALAVELGISRVKLRDVLATLEANGYISRKKGVGTLINQYILSETARLDIDNIYEEMIAQSGHVPRILVKKIKSLPNPPEHVAAQLNLQPGEGAYLVQKLVFADNVPVIHVSDYIPTKYYNQSDIDMALLASSTFCFIQSFCDELLENLVVHLDACAASPELAELMELPPDFPVMRLDSICYSLALTPMMYSIEYLNTKRIPFSFQKKLNRIKYFRPTEKAKREAAKEGST